jgi:hypothetical protein
MGTSDAKLGNIVGGNSLQEVQRVPTFNQDFPHMTHVEEANRFPHCHVLFRDSDVFHRHLPTCERRKLCT